MSQLIKDILEGKTSLIDEINKNNKEAIEIYNKYFKEYPLDYFSSINVKVLPKNILNVDLKMTNLPDKGIITNDGKIYKVIGHKHIITALWLKLNSIDLTNSVRYFSFMSGLEFYPGYDCFGKIVDVENIEQIIEQWNYQYEECKTERTIVGLSQKQFYTLKHLGNYFDNDVISAMTRTNCFGLCKKFNQYTNEEDAYCAKYNHLFAEDILGFDYEYDILHNVRQ